LDFIGAVINEFKSLPKFWWLWLVVTAVVSGIITVLWMKRKAREISTANVLIISFLAAYILFILFETVIGRSPGEFRAELIPFWSYGHPELRKEIIMNYLLFMPLGVLLSICVNRRKLCVEIGLCLSICIELYQLITKTGLFEFDDIIGNTAGCLIGVAIGKAIKNVIRSYRNNCE